VNRDAFVPVGTIGRTPVRIGRGHAMFPDVAPPAPKPLGIDGAIDCS
jgi:hypothetical protein